VGEFSRKIIYFSVLISLLYLTNSGDLEKILDYAIGTKWSEPIVFFLKSNTQGLIVILLVTIYLDYIKENPNKKIGEIVNSLSIIKENINAIKTKQASTESVLNGLNEHIRIIREKEEDEIENIKKNIKKLYKIDNINGLINLLISKKPLYFDVSVYYEIRDHKTNHNLYNLYYRIDFTSSIKEYILAIVEYASLQSIISATSTRISDVLTIPAKKHEDQEYTKMINDKSCFSVIESSSDNYTIERGLVLTEIQKDHYKHYLNEIDERYYNDIVLYKCDLNDLKDPVRYSVKFPPLTMNKNDHYVYWTSDRLMFLKSITFDARDFSYENCRLNLHPLFACYKGDIPDMDRDNYFCFNINSWIIGGQGAIFSWR